MDNILKENELFLKDNLFLGGDEPSSEDGEFFKLLLKSKYKPEQTKYPSIWAWYSIIILFEDDVIKEWLRNPKKNAIKTNKVINEVYICDEPDDFDINKNYSDIIKEQRNKHKDEISNVFLEIKPDNINIDLNLLAKKIIREIKREGLSWNEKYEIKEIAFDIKKLIMRLSVRMETSVQDIVDQLETWEEEIQSIDFILFN